MISEAEKVSREFYTACAESEALCEPVGIEKLESYVQQFLDMESDSFDDGLIFVVIARSLVSSELTDRHMRTQAKDVDEYEQIIQALDWMSLAALELLSKGLNILSAESDTPIEPQDYISSEIAKPTRH